MKQILQNLGSGETEIIDTPCPQIKKGHVLIKTKVSLISTGTEKTAIQDSKTGIVKKVINQPKKVKKAWQLYQQQGFETTMQAIKKQFDFPITMGYSNVGVVIGVGSDITEFKIGDRVLSNGPHSEIVNVAKNLCAKIPDNVSDQQAAFTVLSSIGLQGVRLVQPTLGESVAVMGLGIIGLLTVQILKANGCHVIAIDPVTERVEIARSFGAVGVDLSKGEDPVSVAQQMSDDVGIDAVIITAATASNTPIEQSAMMCRKRGRIVLTGVVGLNIDRNLFYQKELSFQVSCSYGPGRYDSNYEQLGQDYPLPFVRWTEKRNFKACLDLMNENKINCDLFLKEQFKMQDIKLAYDKIYSDNPPLTVLINYPENLKANDTTIKLIENKNLDPKKANFAIIGVGNYSQNMIIPTLQKCQANIISLASQSGLSSTLLAKKLKIAETTTDINSLMRNKDINTLIIATRHNTHSELVCKAIENNKNIFVEKPLCIDQLGLEKVKQTYVGNKVLMLGYNRRFSPLSKKIQQQLKNNDQPRFIQMNINAGFIPSDHWAQLPESGGGRLIGEACHFIDLSRFFANSKITDITARAMKNCKIPDENISLVIQFANGSIASINYYANGSKFFAKESIQVSNAGSIYQIDDFKSLKTYCNNGQKITKLKKQDKGQFNMFSEFIHCIEHAEPSPIAFEEIIEVADFTLRARKMIS